MRYAFPCNRFHHAVFTILFTHAIDLYHQEAAGDSDDDDADKGGQDDDVHDREQDEQQDEPAAEVPDGCCFHPLELVAAVNTFFDILSIVNASFRDRCCLDVL